MAGKVGNALAFDGADDTVEIADNSNLSPVKEITIDAWVQPDVLSGLHNIYRRDVDGNRILLSFQSGGNCADGGFPAVTSPCLAFGINTMTGGYREFQIGGLGALTGAFHHVAATYDGTSRKIYIDGVLAGSIADSGDIGISAPASAFIGSVGGTGEFFDGLIDEVEFFDRALSADEIENIFLAGSARKCKVTVEIDIKPGSDPNAVNPKSKGVIPVAVLGSVDFDATQVNSSTVVFGPDEASPVHDGHVEDVNGDFFDDMVFHFKGAGIACSDTDATLTGATFGSDSIGGTDAVKTAGCK